MHPASSDTIIVRDGKETYDDVLVRSAPDDARSALARYVAELDLAQAALLAGAPQAATEATTRALAAKTRISEQAYPHSESAANSMGIQLDLVKRLATPYSTIGDPCTAP
jgi:hypothetical protein